MMTSDHRSICALLCVFVASLPASFVHAGLGFPDHVIRPMYKNTTTLENVQDLSENDDVQMINAGITFFPGLIQDPDNDLAGDGDPPTDGTRKLNMVSFGQPFASYIPYRTFADDVLNNGFGEMDAVNDKLYPTNLSQTTSMIKASDAAFRYKYVVYGPNFDDPDDPGRIINLFNETFGNVDGNSNPLWDDAIEGQIVAEQLEVLWAALAHSPLDIDLRNALLEAYFDRSVIKMQFVRKRLAKLASIRLALQLPSGFIIDQEIRTYREMIAITETVLMEYGELLSKRMNGIDPSSFDPNAPPGAPLGYYLFTRAQPTRNQTQSRFATALRVAGIANNVLDVPGHMLGVGSLVEFTPEAGQSLPTELQPGTTYTVIDDDGDPDALDADKFRISSDDGVTTHSITDTGSMVLQVRRPPDIIDPANAVPVFMGYKDYRHLLTIIGQHIQFNVELARLLGMRGSPGDTTDARSGITSIQSLAATDVCLLSGMFPKIDDGSGNMVDPWSDESGVNGAFASVKTALSEIINVRGFLNGETNVLGLDRNFLLLLQKGGSDTKFDTYDLLWEKLHPGESSGGALENAETALLEAKDKYETFRGAVDEISTQLNGLDDDFKARFIEITGYAVDGDGNPPPEWKGSNPLGGEQGISELSTTMRTISSLERSQQTLQLASKQFIEDIEGTIAAIKDAGNIESSILDALETYEENTASAFKEIQIQAGVMAGAQGIADGGLAALSDPLAAVGIIAAAGANAIVQTYGATRTAKREKEIDRAAMQFDATLATVELPLVIQQTMLELGAIKREQYDTNLAIEENNTAIAQAFADRAALICEADRLVTDIDADRKTQSERYYADPIHFIRAEQAILKADAQFRRAQRWVFFTVRALEYKWQEKFATGYPALGKNWDAGSVLGMRNATELREMFDEMYSWDQDRSISAGADLADTAIISLRDHIFAPNPADPNLTFPRNPTGDAVDRGIRRDPVTGDLISPSELFRRIVDRSRKVDMFRGSPDVPIVELRFSTRDLKNLPGDFFSPANYRDKINQIGVHVIDTSESVLPDLGGIQGELFYGGTTYFRTRVPVCPTTRQQSVSTLSGDDPFSRSTDFASEFVIAPFRFYQDTNFTGIFELKDHQEVNKKFAIGSVSVNDNLMVESRVKDNFLVDELRERSVAATGWVLRIRAADINFNTIEDIEVLISHTAKSRAQIDCP